MNKEQIILLQLLEHSKNKNCEIRLREFEEFISILISLTDDLHTDKVETEHWRAHLETHLMKFSMHSASLVHLMKGTPLTDNNSGKQFLYPDLGSIYLIMRAQIENYLMFYYLNVQPNRQKKESCGITCTN